jgi:transposase
LDSSLGQEPVCRIDKLKADSSYHFSYIKVMKLQTNYTGIDISKLFFDVAFEEAGKYRHYQFSNDQSGFDSLLNLLSKDQHVVMEASGPYYLRLACFLHGKGIAVSVINPLVIRRFSQMRMSRAKTDKKDALMIAEYGKTEHPTLWAPPLQHEVNLQQMEGLLFSLNKEYTALRNQKGSFESSGMLSPQLEKILSKELAHKEALMAKISVEMQAIAEEHYSDMLKKLESIPGLGKKTAMMLVVITGGFKNFDDYRKLSSYFGLCPRIFESGTSVRGKARICKMGMSRIRAMLYLCSWSAKRCNKACRELYERIIAKGKAKKLALIAVANKLIKQAFAIATKETYYNENYCKNICF